MGRKVTLAEKYEAIVAYESGKLTMAAVARQFGVTRQGFRYWLEHEERIRAEMAVRATLDQAEDPAHGTVNMPSIEYYKKKNKDLEKEVGFLKVQLAYSKALNGVLERRLPPEESKKKACSARPSASPARNAAQGGYGSCARSQESPGTDTTNT